MTEYEPFLSLGLALSAGLLIGLEREQSAPADDKPEGGFLGGARTFPIFALVGACTMLLARQVGLTVVAFGFLAAVTFLSISYARRGADRPHRGHLARPGAPEAGLPAAQHLRDRRRRPRPRSRGRRLPLDLAAPVPRLRDLRLRLRLTASGPCGPVPTAAPLRLRA